MPHTGGPCSAAKYEATLWGSLLRIRLISPWRYRCTSLERWVATLVKPIIANMGSRVVGVGEANSMNSKPIRLMGFSKMSAIFWHLKHLIGSMGQCEVAVGGAQEMPRTLRAR